MSALEIWKENILSFYEGKKIGKTEAIRIVGGQGRLFELVEAGKIESYERQRGERTEYLYNGRQVIEHICNWRRKTKKT